MAKRILIADDSVTIQRAFAMVYTAQDVSVLGSRSLDDALGVARRERPDVIVADVALGAKSGYDLCAAVKNEPGLRHIPVLMLASTHNPFDEAKARQAGADGHLTKPFDSQTVIDKLAEVMAKAPSAAASAPVAAPAAPAASSPFSRSPATPAWAAPKPEPKPVAKPMDDVEIDEGDEDDGYGEFTIERTAATAAPAPSSPMPSAPTPVVPSRPAPAPAAPPPAAMRPAASAPRPAPAAAPAPPRPSLIPGVNPAQVGNRPGAPPIPKAPPPSAPIVADVSRPGAASAPLSRTMLGMPAAQSPAKPGPGASARPAPSPGFSSTPTPVSRPDGRQVEAKVDARTEAKIESKVDEKLAAFAAKGPEYEAIAKLSREVIEQVVWEVVPELAELLIREQIDRLAAGRK